MSKEDKDNNTTTTRKAPDFGALTEEHLSGLAEETLSKYVEKHGAVDGVKAMTAWAWMEDLVTKGEAWELDRYLHEALEAEGLEPGDEGGAEPGAQEGKTLEAQGNGELGDGGTGEVPDLGIEGTGSETEDSEGDPAGEGRDGADARSEGRARGAGPEAGAGDDVDTEDQEDEPGPLDPDYTPTSQDDFETIWAHLSDNQRRYVLARQSHSVKAYAAEHVDIHRDTVYGWPDYVEACASKMLDKQKDQIAYALQKLEYKGIRELERLLDDGRDERTVLEAVRTIFNRNRGKPTQKQQVEHSGGIEFDPNDEEQVEDLFKNLDADS